MTDGYIVSITIENNSSYDLHIDFKVDALYHNYSYKSIDIRKGESVSFNVGETQMAQMGHPQWVYPNIDVKAIVFSHLDTNIVINEVNNNNLFKAIEISSGGYTNLYFFEITNDLLF